MRSRGDLIGKMSYRTTGDHAMYAKDDDMFLSLTGVLYVIVNSRKVRGKELKHYIFTDIIPRGFNKIIEEKQQALESSNIQHQLAIEVKDTALALVNDGLDESQRDNLALQRQNEILRRRYVPHLGR